MSNDPQETMVASGGQAFIAPLGTALPTAAGTALDPAFLDLGYWSVDGLTVNTANEVTALPAFQEIDPIRRIRTGREFSVSFQLLQHNEITTPFAHGGGTIADEGGGEFSFEPPEAEDQLDEVALVLDLVDGVRGMRLVIPRGSTSGEIEETFVRGEFATMPVTFNAIKAEGLPIYKRYWGDPEFAYGS